MQAAGGRQCLAALIYVYDHHQRELPKRLTSDFHDHHDLAWATLHVHLDHESCLEVTVLKGPGEGVQELANLGGCWKVPATQNQCGGMTHLSLARVAAFD
jgi:CopG family nickel-responsive transcriptional regulator